MDRHGRKRGGFEVDVFRRMTDGRFTSLRRSDLAATIYRRSTEGRDDLRRLRRGDRGCG